MRGKACCYASTACGRGDHPRVCGEKPALNPAAASALGSPPRMRGKAGCSTGASAAYRITPAYAGKRRSLCCCFCAVVGSPPRMRGKGSVGKQTRAKQGITPAYAGKSFPRRRRKPRKQDHPRVCGEKGLNLVHWCCLLGSPPRMRGKVRVAPHTCLQVGITPAYAGKRLKRSRSTVPPVAIVPLFPSVCNKPVVSDGSPAGRDAPLFLPAENAVPASPAYNLRSL